ncbi:hypothetical protein N0V90_011506 [Kalmusia sp. IMI 367209]|nr:hypothetical protein N0V90_011506 [Kalmusia sp. IMI 367209]
MSDFVLVESPIDDEFPTGSSVCRTTSKALEGDPATLSLRETSKKSTPEELRDPRFRLKFLDTHPFVRTSVVDKIYGCIIGSALGDAIGLYTEFLPKHACDAVYKSRKFSLVDQVTEYYADTHRMRFEPRGWTDDTDQALLILLSYLSKRSDTDGLAQDFANRLQIWISHGLRALNRPPCGIGALVGSVVSSPSYLASPCATAIAAWVKSARHAAPNGSLMRTHPIGIIGITLNEKTTWDLATEVDLIMEGGDADTNGAVAGALMGVYLGHSLLPSHWAQGLAHKEWLDGKITRLCRVLGVLKGDIREEVDEKPDAGKGLMSKVQLEERDRAMLMGIMERKRVRDEKERREGRGKGFVGWFTN